ncbi:MAG: heavy-metal-associated domain-containing protein [Candidatus Levybacteria bacterium]|nr:heavy-metal-associated domain-containing protein [Candidatus Levybacteria bacterium]
MHPEIEQDHPGKCPKCGGMELVPKDEISQYSVSHSSENKTTSWKRYMPLIVIISLILLTSLTISLKDFQISALISNFMIGFFLVFSGFKLMDLKGFAEGYSTYDLLAKKWFGYGYIYPFIELFFGLGMILLANVNWLLWTELFVMTFSGLGVALKIAKKEKFQCACLGTFLKVPLTKVTLIEDFGMAGLALLMLII